MAGRSVRHAALDRSRSAPDGRQRHEEARRRRGHIINHRSVTKAGVTLGVYDAYDYSREKREALERWADHVVALVNGKTVDRQE